MTDKAQVTSLINAWRQGEDGALDDLIPFVYRLFRPVEMKDVCNGCCYLFPCGESTGRSSPTRSAMTVLSKPVGIKARSRFGA
jgi:hypothetical protein